MDMDEDRIEGAAQQGIGAVKAEAGKAPGDQKLLAEGEMEKAEGKIRDAVGGAEDALCETVRWTAANRR
jgi:uncharacterized protein YjbJ (UPF0337 family)